MNSLFVLIMVFGVGPMNGEGVSSLEHEFRGRAECEAAGSAIVKRVHEGGGSTRAPRVIAWGCYPK